ncbi:tail tube [Acidovorax phage ACP17]|uniref:Tail tube protein n=1 Tax=Acidovorax phage ACP17 TaxID=2010329 RepID=A0A218M3F0_9CAUD|nr:tail tube [Acidovorax phage ACP17]ASD50574.1 hypothetical protein [Acidovorax phage ACP17]
MTTKMDIWSMLSHFRDGISRPNKYRVEMNLPSGVGLGEGEIGVNSDARAGKIAQIDRYFNATGGINFKCHTMTFPQRSLLTSEHRQNSAPFRTPFSATYDPVTFSFYANSYMDTRDYFEVWQSAVVNLGTNTMNFYNEYVADVKLYMLDDYGNDAYSVTLFEAWPLNIGIVDASYSQSNALTTCTVTLAFKSWAPEYNSQSNPSA